MFGQTISLTSTAPSVSGTICPGRSTYSVTVPTGCTPFWSATNGSISGSSNQPTLSVDWADTPNATASLSVTFSGCTSSSDNSKTGSWSALILSVGNQNFDSYNNTINIDYCTTKSVTVTVPHMYVQGTGGIAQPALTEVIYDWTIPTGWHSNVGSQTTINAITLYPNGCAVRGIVSVKGSINYQCGSAGESAAASITLNGTNPVVTLGVPQGYTGSKFCNTTPVTFTASLSPSSGCVSGYVWNVPPSWSLVSQTGNTASIRPSGTSADNTSGPISVTVQFSCGTSITSGAYTPPYTAPTILGPPSVCSSGASFSVSNAAGASVIWSSGNTSGLTVSSQANGTFTAISGFQGSVVITASLTCGANQTSINNTVYVGLPAANNNTLIYASGYRGANPVSLNASSTYRFICDQVSGATSFNWVLPKGFSFLSANGSISEFINTSATTGSYTLFCAANNACGSSWTHSLGITLVSSGGGGGIAAPVRLSAYPNPATSTITVQVTDSISTNTLSNTLDQPYQLLMMDRSSNKVFSVQSADKILNISTDGLPSDIYYLRVLYKDAVLQRQIIIKK